MPTCYRNRKFTVEEGPDSDLIVRLTDDTGILVFLTAGNKSMTVTTPRHQEPADLHGGGHGFKVCY